MPPVTTVPKQDECHERRDDRREGPQERNRGRGRELQRQVVEDICEPYTYARQQPVLYGNGTQILSDPFPEKQDQDGKGDHI